ncbi:hypothetical protein Pcinc_008098 [Petrolisthes cinctipes]|uniref:Uncharacterized protein n=1 Tax=Petrolisthes cinctipes TaxID=88211 RepID=A0AAE1G799_PETCI|nr:hypothetical protein Pcinc_008098 [Petrolisthes cinctipes]
MRPLKRTATHVSSDTTLHGPSHHRAPSQHTHTPVSLRHSNASGDTRVPRPPHHNVPRFKCAINTTTPNTPSHLLSSLQHTVTDMASLKSGNTDDTNQPPQPGEYTPLHHATPPANDSSTQPNTASTLAAWVKPLPATTCTLPHHSARTLLWVKDLVLALQRVMQSVQPTPPRIPAHRTTYVPRDLQEAKEVFICRDHTKPPLQRLYEWPFPVVARNDKIITVKRKGHDYTTSVDRVRAAHIPPAQPDLQQTKLPIPTQQISLFHPSEFPPLPPPSSVATKIRSNPPPAPKPNQPIPPHPINTQP